MTNKSNHTQKNNNEHSQSNLNYKTHNEHEGHKEHSYNDHNDEHLKHKHHIHHHDQDNHVEESHHVDHDHHDHHDHHGDGHHHHGNFKEIFLKSLPLAIPILILSPMMGITLPFQFTFRYSDIIVAILSTILLIYGSKPFYEGAIDEFKQKKPGMMALVSLGISVSYIYSIFAVISHYVSGQDTMDFFFEFASLILIMLLGHWVEMKAVGDAGDAQQSLAELLPKDAHVMLEDDSIETRPVSMLKLGDIVRIQAGENVPADGLIIKGESRINEALLTGEAKPVEKKIDHYVIGGSTNGEGILFVEVKETGEKSFISQVQKLISDAQNQPSRAENMADKVAGWLFYIAVVVAILAFIIWLVIADLQTAINYTVTTLVIACPHALGLAIPLVIARSTSLGASRGLLVKDRKALELATKADIMMLDKTGTLTTGEFKVLSLDVIGKLYSKDELIALMAGIEAGSSHPIAQSIASYANEQNIKPIGFDSIEIVAGAGVRGHANGKHYELISQKAFNKNINIEVSTGATISILVENDTAIGFVALGDELKETSLSLMNTLKSNGIKPIMATGDNEKAAEEIAQRLGINYHANLSPQDKYELVEALKSDGNTVIMVGDGVNDAPSLALADVGVAIGAGTQVALDSADLVLTQSDPGDIESFLELSHKTNRKMKQNLVWGAGYNFIAIPLAAGILAPIGISLTPAVGAILMSISTIIVAINAIMLKLDN